MSGALAGVSDATDVREGGRWSAAQRAKNDLLFVTAVLALHATRLAPRPVLRAAGRGLGRLLHAVLFGERRRALANVARALPELDEPARRALVARTFVELGGTIADTAASLWSPAPPLTFAAADQEVLREALRLGRGVVLPSAHIGPWERVASTLIGAGFPLTTLVRESYDRRFDAWMARLRGRAGVRTIPRGGPGAATKIVRTLRSGGVLGAPMDLKSRVPSEMIPFFGVPAPTPIGPARIAHRAGAPIVVATVERVGHELALTCTRLEPGTDALETTRAINAELTRRIGTALELWPWMHPRFAD